MLQDIWAEADALLATPARRQATAMPGDVALPSVWDDVDAVLATPPPKITPALEPGNVDLYAQPKIKNADGSISTVDSRSYNIDGREVLLPSVTADGRHLTRDEDVVAEYQKTGRHLGRFDSPASATAYAKQLHNDYAAGKYDRRPPESLTPEELDLVDRDAATREGRTGPPVPPASVPPPDTPTVPGFFNPKTGTRTRPPAAGAGALESGPVQIAAGVVGLAKAAATPSGPPIPGAPAIVNPKTGSIHYPARIDPATIQAGNDLAEGLMKAATPFIAAGALAEPVATATALVKAGLGAVVGEKAAAAAGASPEVQSLVGNVAALISGTVDARDIVARINADAADVAAAIRADPSTGVSVKVGPLDIPLRRVNQNVTGLEGPTEPVSVGSGSTDAAAGRVPAAGEPPVPPRADLVPPGEEARFNATQTPAGESTLTPETTAEIDRVLGTTSANELAQREAAAAPPAFQDLGAIEAGRELERRVRAGAAGAITPETSAEIDRILQEKPDAIQEPGAVAGSVQRGVGAGDAAAGPPVGAGNADAIQGPTGARVEEVAPPVTRPPGAAAQPPVIPSQTSAATMEAAHAGSVETPVAPAGPLARGGPEERADADAGGPPAAPGGAAGSGARERPQSAAAAARAAETDTLDSLIQHAQAHGYAGDEDAARRHLEERLALIKDLDQEFADSGRNPETLLRDIARLGGLSVRAETGLKGELRWLKEFQDRVGGTVTRPRNAFGQVRGIQGVFNERGRSVDDMLTLLQQEPRYHHLDTLDTLLEEIRAAATAAHEPTAVQRLREGLGDEWWKQVVRSDRLDTGEAQDRLPGTEAARQAGKADTSFRAPVQATGDDFARSFLGEDEMPVEVEGDLFNDEPGNQGMARRPFTGAWDRLPRTPGERPSPPVPPRKGQEPAARDLLDEPDDKSAPQGMPRREGPPVQPRPSPSPGTFFGKQDLPANRPTTLPARRFGRKVRVLPVPEIVQKLTDLFGGVPVSVGRLYKGYLGVYQPQKESIRVQVADDLHVIAHEMGHHLDMAVMEGSVVFNRGPIAKELKRLGAPTSMPSYSPAMQRREGTAEFFRRWLTDETDTPRVGAGVGQALAQEAPRFTAAFEQYLERHPKIGKGLREIRNDVQRYLALPAHEQARLHIDFEGGGSQILKTASALAKAVQTPEGRRDVISYLSTLWMDDLAAIQRVEQALADGTPIDIAHSAYTWARLARGHASKAEGFLKFGVRNLDGTFMGPSLDHALAPVMDRLRDWALYAAARRAETLHARGLESGFTQAQITDAIAHHQSPVFDQAIQDYQKFRDAMLDYMVEGDVLSVTGRAKLRKVEPEYIPYWRVQDTVARFLTGKSIANRSSPVKRMKGDGGRIVNPLETVFRNTHATVTTVEENRAFGKLVKLALATQGHGWAFEEIPALQVATRFNLKQLTSEVGNLLEAEGVELPEGGTTLQAILDEFVTVFTPRTFATGKDHIVTWLDGGKLRWFEVHDQGLYDAIVSIGPRNVEEVMSVFQFGARGLTKMATSTIGFLLRNPVRDQLAAVVQSRAGYRPGIDWIRGLFHYVGHDEVYQLYVNSLADQATFVSDNRDLLRKRLRGLRHGPLRTFLDHTILGPFEGLSALSHAGESATRIGEFARTLDKAGFWRPNTTSDEKRRILTQGALNARDVSQDFQRKGVYSRQWNNYSAFFSARIGGYGRMWETFEENPTGSMWKALAAIALPSLLLWVLNHENEEYNQLPGWERNYYWHVPLSIVGLEGFFRLPKPFELGQIFGSSTELALEILYKKDPTIANRLPDASTAKQLFQEMFMTAVLPVMEVQANYDYFRDRTIVNPWQEDLAPPLQYGRWTSETAKQLGELLNTSPAKIDTLIYGYTAGVGQGIVQNGLDPLLGASRRPAGGAGRWPGVGTFYRPYATADAEALTEFFTARDALAGLKASVKQYRQMGREDRAQALIKKNQWLAPAEARIPEAERQIKALHDDINQVFASKTMLPEEKRTALDAVYLRMINISLVALGKAPLHRKPPALPPAR